MKPTRLIVVRHGGTRWHDEQKVVGQQNAELSLAGLHRAEQLAQYLDGENIDVIYTSRLGRAMDTGKVIAKYFRKRIVPMPQLDERSYGCLEGASYQGELPKAEQLTQEEDIDEGENRYVFEMRTLGFLSDMLKKNEGKTVLLVTHEGPVKIIQKYFTRTKSEPSEEQYKASFGGITEFEIKGLRPEEVKVKHWDSKDHLK